MIFIRTAIIQAYAFRTISAFPPSRCTLPAACRSESAPAARMSLLPSARLLRRPDSPRYISPKRHKGAAVLFAGALHDNLGDWPVRGFSGITGACVVFGNYRRHS
jgi:hypothetical protein